MTSWLEGSDDVRLDQVEVVDLEFGKVGAGDLQGVAVQVESGHVAGALQKTKSFITAPL